MFRRRGSLEADIREASEVSIWLSDVVDAISFPAETVPETDDESAVARR